MNADRRAARREFKERKVRAGVVLARCVTTGETWVGSSRNVDATITGLSFGLRTGGHLNKALQAVWNAQGEASFEISAVEIFEEDLPAMTLHDLLRDRMKHWRAQLGAAQI